MNTFRVVWSYSGLTDGLVTVDYYEEQSINATVTAVYEELDNLDPENPVVVDTTPCYITIATEFSGEYNISKELTGRVTGLIQNIFNRAISYLVDDKDWSKRTYGAVSRIQDLPAQKIALYSYIKEQIPEKEIPVVATAWIKNGDSFTKVGTHDYAITVLNTFDDRATITRIIDEHKVLL